MPCARVSKRATTLTSHFHVLETLTARLLTRAVRSGQMHGEAEIFPRFETGGIYSPVLNVSYVAKNWEASHDATVTDEQIAQLRNPYLLFCQFIARVEARFARLDAFVGGQMIEDVKNIFGLVLRADALRDVVGCARAI